MVSKETCALVLLLAISAVNSWDFISKNCCEPHDDEHKGRICDDGSRAPLFGCCGKGACNIMCCNCDDGCITGDHKPYKFLGVWGAGINANLGMSGGSAAEKGSKIVKALVKGSAVDIARGTGMVGVEANKNDTLHTSEETEIEYYYKGK